MLRRKFRLCVMAEHISLLKEIVQQAWDNKESTQEQFLRTHLDSLEESFMQALLFGRACSYISINMIYYQQLKRGKEKVL